MRANQETVAKDLQAAVVTFSRVVFKYTCGAIPAPPASCALGVRHIHVRHAPHFAEGVGADDPGCVAYTAADVANHLGSVWQPNYASRWMRVAQQVLEAFELGLLSQEAFDLIISGKSPWSVQKLRRDLLAKKRVWVQSNRPMAASARYTLKYKAERLFSEAEFERPLL